MIRHTQKGEHMNIRRSINKALADKGLQKKWLVESLGWDSARMSRMCTKNNAEIKSVALVANALDMKLSEFIALGE